MKILDRGYTCLAGTIFAAEHRQDGTYIHLRKVLYLMFASMPVAILKAAIDGSLPYKVLSERDHLEYDSDKPEHLQHASIVQRNSPLAPALYGRFLKNSKGLAPSANQMMIVVNSLRAYVSGKDIEKAVEIDYTFNPGVSTVQQLEQFNHHYLKRLDNRVALAHTWCHAIELKCKDVPQYKRDRPYPRPLTYCGYAKSIKKRSADYENHRSTTWLVNLVDAAFKVYVPEEAFRFEVYTVCFLAAEEEAQLSERAFTLCLEAKVHQGGFCVVGGGQCFSSKRMGMNEEERKRKWQDLSAWRETHTPVEENTTIERAKMEELIRLQSLPPKKKDRTMKIGSAEHSYADVIAHTRGVVDADTPDLKEQRLLENCDILERLANFMDKWEEAQQRANT